MPMPLRFIVYVCYLLLPVAALATDSLKLSMADWSFDDIQAQNLTIDLVINPTGLGFTAYADSVQLAAPVGELTELTLQCDHLQMVAEKFSCVQGQISFSQHDLGQQQLVFNITGNPDEQYYKITLTGLTIASAEFAVIATVNNDKWQVLIDESQLLLTPLISFISPYLSATQQESLAKWDIEADINLAMNLSGQASQLNAVILDLTATNINLSDDQGLYVTEAVASSLKLTANQYQQGWQWQTMLNIAEGQGYGEPVFVDFTTTPIALQAEGIWLDSEATLQVNQLTLQQRDVMQLQADAIVDNTGLTALNLELEESSLAALYSAWIQPFVVGTAVDDLELVGDVTMQFQLSKDDYQVEVGLADTFIHQQAELFSIDDLSGTVAWTNYDRPVDSELHWQAATIYAIPLGSSTIKTRAESSSLVLLEPWTLPILDGDLKLNNFSLQQVEDGTSQWTFDGKLHSISMESLSSVLGWPLLHGKLSGVIPHVSYLDQKIQIDGELQVNLFEGNTIIRDLTLNQPFGVLPQLQADVSFKGINLEILTQTFDFGKITGKLDGTVNNLRLANWQPVQFDAVFATPEGDKSRRKISQQAVDNLSQIGGGATGILQRSFLRFFEEFSYQRLGLSCALRNEVCEMSGVAEAEQGYYIVKGGGLPPRINVVGYTRRVNWPDLIERLKAVSQSSGPVIK